MVNEREKKILEKYEEDGWKVIRGGWPDFLVVKTKNGKIVDAECVEVKSENGKLRYNQSICRNVLEDCGLDYSVEVVK